MWPTPSMPGYYCHNDIATIVSFAIRQINVYLDKPNTLATTGKLTKPCMVRQGEDKSNFCETNYGSLLISYIYSRLRFKDTPSFFSWEFL